MFTNGRTGNIELALIAGYGDHPSLATRDYRTGTLTNYGTIVDAVVDPYGRLNNDDGGSIEKVIVNDEAILINSNASVGGAVVNGGLLQNTAGGSIGKATIYGGKLENYATIKGDVILAGGILNHTGNATVGTVYGYAAGTGLPFQPTYSNLAQGNGGTFIGVNRGEGQAGQPGGNGGTSSGADGSDGRPGTAGFRGTNVNGSKIAKVEVVSGILRNGVGGSGAAGGNGGDGGNGGNGGFASRGGDGGNGGSGAVGPNGGNGTGRIATVNVFQGATLMNGVGGDGGDGGNGGNGGNGGWFGPNGTGGNGGNGNVGGNGGDGHGYIDVANIESGGTLYNGFGGFNGSWGDFGNPGGANAGRGGDGGSGARGGYAGSGEGHIEVANVYTGGTLRNGRNGGNLLFGGGAGYGFIQTANIMGGTLVNSDSYGDGTNGNFAIHGWISKAYLSSGTLDNRGWIDKLIYTGGTYDDSKLYKGNYLPGWTGVRLGYHGEEINGGLGTLQIGNGGSPVTFNRNIFLDAYKNPHAVGSEFYSTWGSVVFDHTGVLYYDETISGSAQHSGNLIKNGAGTLVLRWGTNTYTGDTIVNGGALRIGNGGNTTGSIAGNVILAAGTEVQFNRNDNFTYNGKISGAGDLMKSGAGTLTLGGGHTYTGRTTISGGTLAFNLGLGVVQTLSGISGSGGLTKSGSGTLTLTGNNVNFTGTTTVTAGLLENYSTLRNATVTGGWIDNYTGTITNATVSGGRIRNTGGTLGTATLNSGRIYNDAGTLGTVTNIGGTLDNGTTTTNATITNAFASGGTTNNNARGTMTFATVSGDGTLNNYGRIDNLTYNGGTYTRTSTGSIGTLTVNRDANGINWGNLAEANVNNAGILSNAATINTATVAGGTIYNDARIGALTVNGGSVYSNDTGTLSDVTLNDGIIYNDGRIDALLYTGGEFNSNVRGTIGTLTVNGDATGINWGNLVGAIVNDGGTLDNFSGNTIASLTMTDGPGSAGSGNDGSGTAGGAVAAFASIASVNGGTVNNYGTISNVSMDSGILNNTGLIGNMIYGGGTFNGAVGFIDALTIAGFASGNDFGTVENLAFTSDGNGYMTINGFLGNDGGLSFMPSFHASTVDLTGANLMLDFAGAFTGPYTDFETWTAGFANSFENGLGAFGVWGASWGTLFGIEDNMVSGWEFIETISVGWGGDQWAYIWEDGGVVNRMWTANDWGISADAAVPEPATLAIIGLGLVGLGYARRRQQMRATAAA